MAFLDGDAEAANGMAAATPLDWIGNDDDESLVAAALEGDEAAFSALYERWSGPVRRFARARLQDLDDADDVVQDVFVTVLRSLPAFRRDSRFSTWLFGIAFYACGSRLRSRRRRPTEPLTVLDLDARNALPLAGEGRLDAVRALRRCAEALERSATPMQRQVFQLSELEGRRTLDVARQLGRDPKTVRAHLCRVRRVLRDALPRDATAPSFRFSA
jgi:RNA polymerase sigma-70 factor (ECF subfamily)